MLYKRTLLLLIVTCLSVSWAKAYNFSSLWNWLFDQQETSNQEQHQEYNHQHVTYICYLCENECDQQDLLNPCRHPHDELMCVYCYQHLANNTDECPVCYTALDRSIDCFCTYCCQPRVPQWDQLHEEPIPVSEQVIGECCICAEECELNSPCANNHPAFICQSCEQKVDRCPLCRNRWS